MLGMQTPASELMDQLARVYAEAVVDALLAGQTTGAISDQVVGATGVGFGASPEIAGDIVGNDIAGKSPVFSGGVAGAYGGASPEIADAIGAAVAGQLPAPVTGPTVSACTGAWPCLPEKTPVLPRGARETGDRL